MSAAAHPVPSGRVAHGRLALPPSKSLTNRYLNLALLAGAPPTPLTSLTSLVIERPLEAEDTRQFLAAVGRCGFRVEERVGEWELVPGAPPPEAAEIFCGASGTMLRFLTATLTALPGRWRLDGVPRLRERPVGPLVEALRGLGAEIRCPGREGFAPLEIGGASLRAGKTRLDAGSSSQFLSALLMAALRAPGEVEVEVEQLTSEPYLDLTLAAIAAFGGDVKGVEEVEGTSPGCRCFRVAGKPGGGSAVSGPAKAAEQERRPSPMRVRVEGDASAACYPAAAAALTGGEVTLAGLPRSSAQGDRDFLDLLATMGASVSWTGEDEVVVRGAPGGALRAVEADLAAMPDQVPTLAAVAPFAAGTTRIVNVPHLRFKESDRLRAMASQLQAAGVPAEETADGLVVPGCWAGLPPTALPAAPVTVDSHGDHRIAMSMALVGLRRPGMLVAEPGVVAKSYPGFWADLQALLGP